MTWEEAQDSTGFNLTGLLTVIAAFFLNLINGTLLRVFPDLKLPEMNINDLLTVVLSIIAGIYTIVKIYHEILKVIDKRQDMKQKKYLDQKIRKRFNKHDSTSNTRREEESDQMDSPAG